jgi:hypothetical protein
MKLTRQLGLFLLVGGWALLGPSNPPASAAVTNDLVFYAPFSTDVNDVQGGRVAHVNGDAQRITSGGAVGGYLQLQNGTIDPEQFIDFEDPVIGTSDFSVSIWVRSTDAANNQSTTDVAFFSNKDWDSGGNTGWVLARAANDGIKSRFQWNFAAGGRKDFDPAGDDAVVFDGNWHHIVVSHARAGLASFYVDGALINTVDISSTAAGDINSGLRLALGNDGTLAYDHGSSSAYNGDLDEAAVWTRALTPDDVAEIYGAARQGFGLYDTAMASAFFKSTVPLQNTTTAAGNTYVGSTIQAGTIPINPGSVKMFFDNVPVTPTVTPNGGDVVIRFQPPQILAAGSSHAARIEAADTAMPPHSITNSWSFTVANYVTVPTAYAKPAGSANTRGFLFRTVQASGPLPNIDRVARTHALLNGTLIDPSTGMPFANIATPGTNTDGSYNLDGTINFEQSGSPAGAFTGDVPFPGLNPGDNDNFVTEGVGFLDLAVGYHRFAVNSDDGFEVSVGAPAVGILSSTALGTYDGDRAASETTFDFFVPVAGIYCFSVIFEENTGGASEEFYSVDIATGEKILINDPNNPAAIKSYRALTVATPPYVRETVPPPNATDVRADTVICAYIWERGTPLDEFSVQMKVNNAAVTPDSVVRDANTGITKVTYQPPSPLPAQITNTVQLVFTDHASPPVTNMWQFTTRSSEQQKKSITGQWDFDNGDLSATIGAALEYLGGPAGPTVAATHFGTTTSFGIPDINGEPAKVMRFDGAINPQIGYVVHHRAVPNGDVTATKVNQWTLIMDINIPNLEGVQYFSFCQIDNLANANDGDLFANFAGGTAGLGISGSYPKDPPVVAGRWHRITFAVDAANTISKYVDGVKTADQTGWSGAGFDGRHAMLPTFLLFSDEDGESQLAYVNSVQYRNYKMTDDEVALLGGPSASGIPAVSGQWDFNNGDLVATIGNDMEYRGDTAFMTAFEDSMINGETAKVMHFSGTTADMGYQIFHGALANPGNQKVNKYSLIMDIMYPSTSTGFRSVWQTDTNNTSDGDLFLNGNNGIGISGEYQGNVTFGAWHRVAFTFDLTKRELGKYVDGTNVLSGPVGNTPGAGPYQYLSEGVDGRWSLLNSALLFSDEDGELAPGFVNSIQFRPVVLTAEQIGLLGKPTAAGIPLSVPARPALAFEVNRNFNEITISFPSSFNTWKLESSPTLGPGALWTVITAVVDDGTRVTHSRSMTGSALFFRLHQ